MGVIVGVGLVKGKRTESVREVAKRASGSAFVDSSEGGFECVELHWNGGRGSSIPGVVVGRHARWGRWEQECDCVLHSTGRRSGLS